MPAAQSRNTLPSTSSTIAPEPRSMTSGYPRVYDGETTVLSRSMIAFAFGPGRGVLICGVLVMVSGGRSTFVSIECRPSHLPEAHLVPPDRPECGRRRRTRG